MLLSSVEMDVKGRLFLTWMILCFLFHSSMSCVRVGGHLDCRGYTHIRGLTRNIDTVIINDFMPPSEIQHYGPILQNLRLIVWGYSNCPVICDIGTSRWIHHCVCQVRFFKCFIRFSLKYETIRR